MRTITKTRDFSDDTLTEYSSVERGDIRGKRPSYAHKIHPHEAPARTQSAKSVSEQIALLLNRIRKESSR